MVNINLKFILENKNPFQNKDKIKSFNLAYCAAKFKQNN